MLFIKGMNMLNNSSSIFVIITLIILLTISSIPITYAQQIDTLKISDSYPPFILISSIDTLTINSYTKQYVRNLSIFNLHSDDFIQKISDTLEFQETCYVRDISYNDINLDNLKDIIFQYADSYDNSINSFWLYDSTHNKFFYSKDFRQLHDYWIVDRKNKIIKTLSPSFRGMSFSAEYKYKIDGVRLILIEEEGWKDADKYGNIYDIESYVFYKKKLINDQLITVELDSTIHLNNEYILKYYQYINDSLLPTSILWADDVSDELTDSSNYKIYFQHRFNGDTYKHYKKVTYDYDVDSDGNVLREINTFVVKNDKWVLVK
jgi:hypothetical protein